MGKIFIPMYSTLCYRYKQQPYRHCGPSHGYSLLDVLLNGVLGQLQNDPDHMARLKPVQPWLHAINMKGFEPENISVKVEDGIAHITARQIDESESGHDLVERYRKVAIPHAVDADQLTCLFAEGGKLILKAPYIQMKQEPMNETLANKTMIQAGLERENVGDRNCPVTKSETDPTPIPEVINVPIEHEGFEKSANEIGEKVRVGDRDLQVEESRTGPTSEPDIITVPIVHEESNRPSNEDDDKPTSEKGDGQATHKEVEEPSELMTEQGNEANHPADVRFVISPPESPTESIEFVIVRDNDVMSENKKTEANDDLSKHEDTEETEVNVLDISRESENKDSVSKIDSNSLPIMDSLRVIDVEGEKYFEISVNLSDFTPENTIIRWKGDNIQIDAEREIELETSETSYQRVHREFTEPDQFDMKLANASMNKGLLRVILPVKKEINTEL